MKKVKGYLTNDQMFFESKEEAELYEATRAVENSAMLLSARPEAVLRIIDGMGLTIMRYIYAKRRADKHHAIDAPSEAANVAVLKLPSGGNEPVSDVGDSLGIEKVRHPSEVYGPRSGGIDASGIRSSEDMATVPRSGIHGSRDERSEQDFWDREMEEMHRKFKR